MFFALLFLSVGFSESRDFYVFSPNADDPRLPMQTELLKREADGTTERDIKVVKVISNEVEGSKASAQELRKQFSVSEKDFQIVLVGKDSTEKFRSGHPITMKKLFAIIDSMPMRQREMKRQN